MEPGKVQLLPKQKEERNKWVSAQRPKSVYAGNSFVPELNLKFVQELNKIPIS